MALKQGFEMWFWSSMDKSVGPIVWQLKYYTESRSTGISYIW